MSIIKHMLLLLVVFLLASCASVQEKLNNYSKHAEAQQDTLNTEKGIRYLLGRGVKQDDARAFHYFSLAARHNNPFAANELAFMYATGKGTQQDYARGLRYYKIAANAGLASAQYNLGLMYQYGLGVNQDKTLADQWIKKSADQGFKPAKQAMNHA